MTKNILIAAAFTVAVALGGPITDSPESSSSTLSGPSAVSAVPDGPLVLTISSDAGSMPAVSDPTAIAFTPTDAGSSEGVGALGVQVDGGPGPVPLAGVVPEPTTFGFLAVGLAATFFGSYRRKN